MFLPSEAIGTIREKSWSGPSTICFRLKYDGMLALSFEICFTYRRHLSMFSQPLVEKNRRKFLPISSSCSPFVHELYAKFLEEFQTLSLVTDSASLLITDKLMVKVMSTESSDNYNWLYQVMWH